MGIACFAMKMAESCITDGGQENSTVHIPKIIEAFYRAQRLQHKL
jgi:hypothetical protein